MPESARPAALDIGGIPLHYLDAGHGPTVVLVHGSLCDQRYWKPQITDLASHYRVLVPSLRGYWPAALQGPSDDFSLETHASDLETLLTSVADGQPAHVVGHSRGAQVALHLARRAPSRVASLTLADPGFRFSDEPAGAPFHTEAVRLLQAGEIDLAMEQFVNAVNGQDIWKKMVPWFKRMVRENAMTLLSQIREIDSAEQADSFALISCPLLLVGGQNSPSRYRTRIQRLADMVWNARQETIPLASHGMNLANPRAFNRAVLDFLALAP